MSTQQSQIDYQTLKQKVGSTDWESATHQLRETPQYPESVAVTVEQQYDKLDPQTQQALEQMPPEAKTSFFHLIGTLNEMGQRNSQDAQRVSKFISECIREGTTA